MPDNHDEFFDDDDDGFFNDEAILAQLDEVETQFTNTQKVSQPPVPPSKRPKLNHPAASRSIAPQRHDPMDYDGPSFYVDEAGQYHNYKSPEPPQRSRTGVMPCDPRITKPSSVSVQSNRPPSNNVQNYALQTRQQPSKSGATTYGHEPAVTNRSLSLGMQALRTGPGTSGPHSSRAAEPSRSGIRSHVQPSRPPEMTLQRAPVLPTGHKPPQPPSRVSLGPPQPFLRSRDEVMNLENTSLRSIQAPQRDQVIEGFDAAARLPVPPSRPLFRADPNPDPSPLNHAPDSRILELQKNQQQELMRLQQQMEAMNQALKEANLEKTRLRGEVSIVRSSLTNHQTSSLQQIQSLRQNEQKIKARAEAAEKELERLQREKETNQIFKGLEANARKPPTSVARKYQGNSTQLTQTRDFPPPAGTSNVRKAPAFRGFKDAFDVSHGPVSDSQVSQSTSQRMNPGASQRLVDPFIDPRSRRNSSENTQLPQVPRVQQSQANNMAEIERNSRSKPTEVSHRIIANLLHNFIIDVNPNVSSKESNLVVGLQFILQCEFQDQSIQSEYNRVTRELFNSLGKSITTDRSISKEENQDPTDLVMGIGGCIFELTEIFYDARLLDSMLISISIITILCETTPLFCSLYFEHPELQKGHDLIPLLARLINEFGNTNVNEKAEEESFRDRLVENLLDLLEVLVWGPTEHGVSRLGQLLDSQYVFDTLLNVNQQDRFLSRSISLLTLLASEPALVDHIFTIPLRRTSSDSPDHSTKSTIQNQAFFTPLIERLVSFIPLSDTIPSKVLRLFIIFASTDENGLNRITHSPTLIARVVRLICQDCDSLFKGDGGVNYRAQLVSSLDRLELSIDLIYQIVFQSGTKTSLMDYLRIASYHIPGIYHEFIVGVGKIAYGELPRTNYLDVEQTARLDKISDLALDLLESVASPDEADDLFQCCDDMTPPEEANI